jgi:hypothetical protein
MSRLTINPNEATRNLPLLTVLAIGPWDRGEFALVVSKLNSSGDWLNCDNCDVATKMLLESEFAPELILIAQTLPGSVRQDEVEALRSAAPLAQIVIVAGSWCEGELRTGTPTGGVLRMYWHEFANWWPEREFSECLDGPLAACSSHVNITNEQSGIVAIYTPSLASFEALASTLALSGFDAQWIRKTDTMPEDATIGIWDGGQFDATELAELQVFAAEVRRRDGQLVVLLDYPRKQHFEILQQIGCSSVFGKPYVVKELIAACSPDR